MISNVNIQQSFNVVDHSIGNGNNQDAKSVCDNFNSQPVSTSMSTPTNETTVMHVTGDNGFSIYERSIDFHKNFGGDQSVATTKDTSKRLVTSQIEPNLLLKHVNNNNHVTSTAAAREIENVHNYSKNLYSTDSTSYTRMMEKKSVRSYNDYDDDEEDDDDDDDIEENGDVPTPIAGKINGSQIDDIPAAKGKLDDDDKSTPDHHARRPMNAFLIFCKRHRAIVREKYPNLENRSITKILGDWWANLDQEEKLCYTNLAKQYKDAFFSANPNFKWYKLPAPPLRTLSTRPGNTDRPPFNYSSAYDGDNTANDSMHRTNGSINDDTPIMGTKSNRGPNVGIFKLADETQMGSLNSLMASYDSKPLSGNNNLGEHDGDIDNSVNQSKMKLTPTNRTEPFTNMRYHAAKMQSQIDNQTNSHGNDASAIASYDPNRPIKEEISPSAADFEDFVHSKLMTPEKNIFLEDENLKKSARACKGKRYLEFMSTGKISPSSKKLKVHHPHSPTSKAAYDREFKEYRQQYSTIDHMYAHSHDESQVKSEHRKIDGTDSTGGYDPSADSKLFDASDFDLEEKIRSLPALSLDKYLSRKRETKKKKKINAKRLTNTKSPQTIGEAKERIRISMVGSQKRKARKESITRRDITHDAVEAVGLYDIVESPKVEEQQITPPLTSDNASDLFILATIAEVAAGAVNATIGSMD